VLRIGCTIPERLFPPEPEGHAGAIVGGFDRGIRGKRFQEIDAASAWTMKIGTVGWVGNEFWGETRATVANGKGYFMIFSFAFELHFARAAFLTAVPYGVRYAFGEREQHVMPKFRRYAGAVELLARPFVNLLQLV
jgi:hypothetical protein